MLAGCTAPGALDADVAEGGDDEVGAAAVEGGKGGGGGHVGNAAPSVTLAVDRPSGDNGGAFVALFTGTISDPNAERDLASVRMVGTGPTTLASAVRAITPDDRRAEPASSFGPAGFKIWDATPNDGALQFQYRQAFPAFSPAGTYSFRATVTDAAGLSADSSVVSVTVTRFSLITLGPGPVAPDGTSRAGEAWGAWRAMPGATQIDASNFIKLVNEGDAPDVRVVIDFTESAFAGSNDSGFSIPIGGNVQFAWWEDTTPATSAPSEGSYAYLPPSPDGTVTVQFSGKGNIIYVKYRLLALPDVLPIQPYTATFTVTDL